ncbi:MAG: AI-2E family transporter [Phycisphaerae bacterium]|nr:AI-2E family transporter [Phycisphaerae bacterium]
MGVRKTGDESDEARAKGPPRDWRSVHLWQIQPIRDGLLILAIFGVLHLGYLLSPVTVPMLLALALAYLFEPLVKRMTRVKWVSRQGAAVAIIAVTSFVVVVPLSLAATYSVIEGTQSASRLAANVSALLKSVERPEDERLGAQLPSPAWRKLRDEMVRLKRFEMLRRQGADPPEGPPAPAHVEEEVSPIYEVLEWIIRRVRDNAEIVGKRAFSTGADAFTAAVRTLQSATMIMLGGVLTAVFFYFFSTGYGRLLALRESVIPKQDRAWVLDLLGKMDVVIAGFVRGRLIIGLLTSAMFVLLYWAIGTPSALVVGVIMGLLSIVPYLSLIGVPVTVLMMWLDPTLSGWQAEWWWVIGAPVGVYTLVQCIADYILTPVIMGKTTDMDMPTILFASIAGGLLAGVYGLLLAIPAAACAKILIREIVWPRYLAWLEGKASDFLPIDPE